MIANTTQVKIQSHKAFLQYSIYKGIREGAKKLCPPKNNRQLHSSQDVASSILEAAVQLLTPQLMEIMFALETKSLPVNKATNMAVPITIILFFTTAKTSLDAGKFHITGNFYKEKRRR